MLIGSDDNLEHIDSSEVDESKRRMQNVEDGELEEGELDDEAEDLPIVTVQVQKDDLIQATSAGQLTELELTPVKTEKKRDRSDSERKVRGHSHHRSVPKTVPPYDSLSEQDKDDDGKDSHGHSQRHSKRRERQKSKDDSEKRKMSYTTYVDFDDMQDDFETEDTWLHGSQQKRYQRSKESFHGAYDSPYSSGEDDPEMDDIMTPSRRNSNSRYQYYGGFYDVPEEEEEENDDFTDLSSDHVDVKAQFTKQTSTQEFGYKGSMGSYHRSLSSEKKLKSQLPRKRKLVDTPMEERPACKFFMEGKCAKGVDCPFNHDFVPPKKEEVCRFYLNERGCTRENCVYYHADWPCRYFHKTGSCTYGDSCKFSHAELTDETKHLIHLDFTEENHVDLWKPSSNYDSFQASEKKKIPSLLDLEIYPPGKEPKLPSPTFSPRGMFKRQRCSGSMSGQPGLLGPGPSVSGGSSLRGMPRIRQSGMNSKGYYSSYGAESFSMDDSSPPHSSVQSPDQILGNVTDEEPCQGRSEDEEEQEQEIGTDAAIADSHESESQMTELSNIPPTQREIFKRLQQQQHQQQQSSVNQQANSLPMEETWYSSDEDGGENKVEVTQSPAVPPTVADIIKSLTQQQQSQTIRRPPASDATPMMTPPVFGMVPPHGMMPRGMPPPREMLHPPDLMSGNIRPMLGMQQRSEMMPQGLMPQRGMMPSSSEMMPQGMGMMIPRGLMPPADMMQNGMMPMRPVGPPSDMMSQGGMMPPRGFPPSDLMPQGMMPPRGMMPPSDMMPQGMMPPRGVLPPSDMMPQLGMMPPRGMIHPPDMMSQGMLPPQGVPPPSDMPPRGIAPPGMSQPECISSPFNLPAQNVGQMPNFDINHILSVIRSSSLLLPSVSAPSAAVDMMTSNSNFIQSHDPRASGNIVDPRLRLSEAAPDVGTPGISSFLQPPESPDQEIEIIATGKQIAYILHPITIDSRPSPPSGFNADNSQNTSDPRLRKYLNLTATQSNGKTKFSSDIDSSDGNVLAKPTDPRLSKRGTQDVRKPDDTELSSNKTPKTQKPYTLPDIVLPVLPSPVQDKPNVSKVTDVSASGRKITVNDSAHLASPVQSVDMKPAEKTLQPNLVVQMPEALQERNFPLDGKLSKQSSASSTVHSNTAANKKVVDYRNDPRYKKKKTKSQMGHTDGQPLQTSEVKESVSPVTVTAKDDSACEADMEIQSAEQKTHSHSSSSQSPFSNDYDMLPQSISGPEKQLNTGELEVGAETEESGSFNVSVLKSQTNNAHTPVAFFEGIPVSSILSDVEPAQELNLKDMFKTIDPTTSPFC